MAEVQPEDIHPGFHQLADVVDAVGGGAHSTEEGCELHLELVAGWIWSASWRVDE